MSEPLPLPSHVHDELLLQLLKQPTLFTAYQEFALKLEISKRISTLRKALLQQRQLEEHCDRLQVKVDYRWPLNDVTPTD